jgi:hypothetical protein
MANSILQTVAAAAIAVAAISTSAPAAEFKTTGCQSDETKDNPNCGRVYLNGVIKPGDGDIFVKLVAEKKFNKGAVFLNSDGGDVASALKIGREIKRLGMNTVVEDQVVCASACGIIWLAGKTRWYDNRSKIGFHAPSYLVENKNGKKSSTVNLPATGGSAIVGMYLAEMGLNEEAIFRLTAYRTDGSLLWLNSALAKKFDIKAINISEDYERTRAEKIAREAAEKVAREVAEKTVNASAKKLDEEQQKRIVPLLADGLCPVGSAIEPFNRTYCVRDKS